VGNIDGVIGGCSEGIADGNIVGSKDGVVDS